jgi:hypothetical protein
MRLGPVLAWGCVIGTALLGPGAGAQQQTPPPSSQQTPQQTTTPATRDEERAPSSVEQLGAELLRRAQEEAARRAREQAAGGGQTQTAPTTPPPVTGAPRPAVSPTPGDTPPPTLSRPPERTAPSRTPSGGASTPPPPTDGPPPSGATPPPRTPRPGLIPWAEVLRDQRQRPGDRIVTAAGALLDPAQVDKTRIPILVPTAQRLLAKPRLYSFGDYYSLNLDQPGLSIELTGTRVFGPTPKGLTRLEADGPEKVSVQRTIDGQLLSFMRYGLLYTVEVRCDSPRDPRCFSDTLVREVYAQTNGVVLGRAARAQAGLGGR